MPRWVYKATRKKRNQDDTLDLARKYEFLCRSAYENERERHPALVHDVKLGNVIHFYYAGKNRVAPFGSYRVVDGSEHPGRFSLPVEGSALSGSPGGGFAERRRILPCFRYFGECSVALFAGVRRGLKPRPVDP